MPLACVQSVVDALLGTGASVCLVARSLAD
jgi:hypothetical protein